MERHTTFSLPSPTDTPYRTPSSSLSRRSREYEDMSPSTTPPPLPSDARVVKKRSNESQRALDENISPLDPRRFTPTLHASLVSEILSLRRDLESKTKSIDQLEQSLDASQSQNEGLSKSLLASNKEIRSVKRQMQLLEGGTLSAINDLSKERDSAVQETTELRKRVEQLQKKAKTHEDSADRTQLLWDQEKESWTVEKRRLETKVHVAEERLKSVLEEIVLVQAQTQQNARAHEAARAAEDIHAVSHNRASMPNSPTSPTIANRGEFRDRRQSGASIISEHLGGRTSVMSLVHGLSTNLADELALDDIYEDVTDEASDGGRTSPDALPEERGRPASSLSIKARKILGLPADISEIGVVEPSHSNSQETIDGQSATKPVRKTSYVDIAIQYSRPSSPVSESNTESVTKSYTSSVSDATDVEMSKSDSSKSSPIMISSSCQTLEYLPSPPLTPRQIDQRLATIPESAFEKVETREIATQTDPTASKKAPYKYVHSRTSTHDLGIPMIAIIPPSSRPATPENDVVLPPRTKNALCQVDTRVLLNYTSTSMQTEEIRIDNRIALVPQLTYTTSSMSKAKSNGPFRHQLSSVAPITSASTLKRGTSSVPLPPINDSGPLAAESSLAQSRPVRSSSLFAGFDDVVDEPDDDIIDEDIFYDDEYSSRPVPKFTLRSGKLVSLESTLEDIGEVSAASAGEALALDNLRRSETSLPPELRQIDAFDRPKGIVRPASIRRAPSASTSVSKQSNVRRSALISSGVAAHQSKHSQSTVESGGNESGMPPPIPIPLRYSSARIGKSYSEGGRNSRGSSNASPTRQYRQKYKPGLRKARSGPALSPAAQARRQRSKSPPHDSRVSIVPEMPQFQMPPPRTISKQPSLTNDFAEQPYQPGPARPLMGPGPRKSFNHVKQNSDAGLPHQTSVVDAIAQTMVGEWMFKYVRRRKSFGKPDRDWDPNRSVEELTTIPTTTGVRHKRWVWLAPYERAVMWSSKQPMNGTALLGKTGRKLIVKSVLDVKDDNPMPKNSLTGPAFNRSILILTPQRALKFTATSQERHFVWLTALSFLSHSPLSFGDLAALPPPPDEYRSPSPPPPLASGSIRRRNIRDSIRVAKGPSRAEGGQRSVTTDGSVPPSVGYNSRPQTREAFEIENDAALPPTIRRYHTRNRSNTAPRMPPSSFFAFTQKDSMPTIQQANPSYHFESTLPQQVQPLPTLGKPSVPGSRRGSEASAFSRPTFGHPSFNQAPPSTFSFSDSSHNASMTMRMDAFIDNKQAGKGGFRNLRLGGPSRAANKDLGFWGLQETPSTISPVESMTPGTNSMRMSDSAGRPSVERDFFRNF